MMISTAGFSPRLRLCVEWAVQETKFRATPLSDSVFPNPQISLLLDAGDPSGPPIPPPLKEAPQGQLRALSVVVAIPCARPR